MSQRSLDIELHINDIFYSVQGEGKYLGIPTLFFRFNKCNIKCKYCDTNFEDCNIGDIESMIKIVKAYIRTYPIKHICFTGGEPLLFIEEIKTIIRIIRNVLYFINFSIKVETNGLLELPAMLYPSNKVIYTITPKLNFINDYEKNIDYIKNNINEINFKFMLDPNTHNFEKNLDLIYEFLKKYELLDYDIFFAPINIINEIDKVLTNYRIIFRCINENYKHPLFSSKYMNNYKGITIQLNKLLDWL